MILRFRVEPGVFVRDCDVVRQRCREALVGFAEVIGAAPVKQIKPAKDDTRRENGRPQKRFNWVDVVINQKVAGFVQANWRKLSEHAPQCVLDYWWHPSAFVNLSMSVAAKEMARSLFVVAQHDDRDFFRVNDSLRRA